MPAVGMLEKFNQLCGRKIAESRRNSELKSIGDNAIDAPLVDPRTGVHVLENLWRQKGGPFYEFAAHVDHIQRSVGSVCKLHGPEPVVRRGEELGIGVGPEGSQADAVR